MEYYKQNHDVNVKFELNEYLHLDEEKSIVTPIHARSLGVDSYCEQLEAINVLTHFLIHGCILNNMDGTSNAMCGQRSLLMMMVWYGINLK